MSIEYLIPFTDDELSAIYDAIEKLPTRSPRTETALASVIEKVTPAGIGNSRPAGAAEGDRRYEAADNERLRLRDALDELAHAAREFSTAADYTTETGIEDEFVTALESAEALLALLAPAHPSDKNQGPSA